MPKKVAGSIRKITLDGITFDAFGSTNIKATPSEYSNEAIATSGDNLRKMVKRATVREGVDIKADGAELEILRALADALDDFSMSYTTAAGDVYRASGWIELESHETEEAKATVKMFSRSNEWECFLG